MDSLGGGMANIGKTMDTSYVKCDSEFSKGINKAKSIRNRRAKRKVEPHIPKMESSHSDGIANVILSINYITLRYGMQDLRSFKPFLNFMNFRHQFLYAAADDSA